MRTLQYMPSNNGNGALTGKDFQPLIDAGRIPEFWNEDAACFNVLADQMRDAVDRRARDKGVRSFFGDQSAYEAVWKLVQHIAALPPADREKIINWMNGDDTVTPASRQTRR